MRTFSRNGVILALSLVASMASASDVRLEVHLSEAESKAKAETGFINVEVTNRGGVPLLLPRSFTPLEEMDGHLLNNIFSVKGDDGTSAKFVGRSSESSPRPVNSFIPELNPGRRLLMKCL